MAHKKSSRDNATFLFRLSALLLVGGGLLLIYFGYWWIIHRPLSSGVVSLSDTKQPTQTQTACDHPSVLSGSCEGVSDHLIAVMIENHPDARPQSGLALASVVYEAPVEANYTRFLALFPSDVVVKKVGPVRSARPYYLDWLREYGTPLYMHVGGSPDALDLIRTKKVNDLNEFFHGWFYWRADERSAPHNVYTSTALWKKALDDTTASYTDTTFPGWRFERSVACTTDCISHITVAFSRPWFVAEWHFNTTTNQYARYEGGVPHLDLDGTPIVADTVIVQNVTTQVLDGYGRISMKTVGEGDMLVFKNGNVISGRWKKETENSRTKWFDMSGAEIVLQPGHIWIEVINQVGKVEYK